MLVVGTHKMRESRMLDWQRSINVSDVFHNDAMSFEQRRDAIVRRVRSSGWLGASDEGDEIHGILTDLEHSTNADEFDNLWDEMYDLADQDRVWIRTS
jgi:hypothetical protein